MKSRKGCAAIYLYTATKIHEMLLKARKSDLQQCAYAQLHPIVVDNLCVAATEVAASELAWKLRHAFNAILKQIKQSKEQEQEQEVALPLETQKVEGLQRWARGAKVATLAIVFTDVLGSTALNRKHGNVKWNGILSTHVDYGKKLIAREYGYLMQTNGDSLLAVFPSTSYALNFAMALECNTGHKEVIIRAGIHVGPVMVAPGATGGQAVCMAKRVMDYIEGGGICLSNPAIEEINEMQANEYAHLQWEKHPAADLKGFEGKFTLWTVPPTRPAATRNDSPS